MEKGFNDDELADIMSEIESLEQEFTDDGDSTEEAVAQEQTESVEPEESHQEEVVAKQEEPVQEAPQEEVVAQQEEPQQEEPQQEESVQEVVVAQQEVQQEQPVAHEVDEEMEEVLEELSDMPVEDVVPEKSIQSYDDNIHHMKQEAPKHESWSAPKSASPAQTSMSFKVEGEMKLDLNFCIGGQDVQLHVSDNGFEIELAGGAKFSLPISNQVKKVA